LQVQPKFHYSMKSIYILITVLMILNIPARAQNKTLGIGTPTPNPTAALHVESPTNNQGMIIPRLTTAQRLAMTPGSTDIGLLVYDLDLQEVVSWDGTEWMKGGTFKSNDTAATIHAINNGTIGTDVAGSAAILAETTTAFSAITARIPASASQANAISGITLSTDPGSWAGYFDALTGTAVYGITGSNVGGTLAPVGVYGESRGTGSVGGAFWIQNAGNNYPALYSNTIGTGPSSSVNVTNTANTSPALLVETIGLGAAANFNINNTANNISGINSNTNGTGNSGYFSINNVSSGAAGVFAITNGTGTAIQGQTSTGFASIYGRREGATNGNAGLFEITDAANTYPALHTRTVGTGAAGNFEIANASSSSPAVFSTTNGLGAPGHFQVTNSSSTSAAIFATTSGTGSTLFVNHTGASGNVAVFQSNALNVARIDKSGQAFFNGGTQTSGADVAEMFDVEGEKNTYEPGDVLVISEDTDRTVEKSNEANSTKVAGVYATKPGVKLTERNIDENLDDLVPMGVIGVIPTKVCLENGPIKRGDLLVTSSKEGHAMKAISAKGDGIFPAGTIIGKALENFDSHEAGLIKVLVNVK
jgi:hypothetical protein